MPTNVISAIGTAGGRDFSTQPAWENALPANLVTADEEHYGQLYNDSEFFTSADANLIAIGGHTTDATHRIILEPAPGQGFADHASAATNPLRYDQSKGVALRKTSGYNEAILIDAAQNWVVIRGLQVKVTAANAWAVNFD